MPIKKKVTPNNVIKKPKTITTKKKVSSKKITTKKVSQL